MGMQWEMVALSREFMEVTWEVKGGAQVGSHEGFSPGKKKREFVQKVIFASHSRF